jgi:hypothetical protein
VIAWNLSVIGVILLVFMATLVNHACLVEIIEDMTQSSKARYRAEAAPAVDRDKILSLTALKLLILIGSLTLGVLFIGNQIIIPLINYVVMIFILGTSLKRRIN